MARPLRVEFPGALYLVTARALSRHRLYRDSDEAQDFVNRLSALHEGFGLLCHGFCLLPSHYHLLLETPRANLSRALHRLNAGFTATTNARRRRKGPLLQSRYRALVMDEQPWLLRLSIHLHLNPVRKKLSALPSQYPWSSAGVFLDSALAVAGLTTDRVLSLAGGRECYRQMVDAAVRTPPKAPWREVWRQSVLGGEELRQRVMALVAERDPREIPGFSARRQGGLSLEEVVATVSEYTGVPAESVFRGKFQRVLARKVALYLARRFTGLTLREIGEAFGVDYTTVHMAARRVEDLRGEDATVDELLREIETAIQLQQGARPAPALGVTSVPPPLVESPTVPPPDVAVAVREAPPRRRRKQARKGKDSPQLKLF